MNNNNQMSLRLWLLLCVLGLIWGGSFFFGRIIMAELPALTATFLRVAPAALILWLAVFLLRRRAGFSIALAAPLLMLAILNNVVPFSLILWGQKEIGSGLASIINAMTPIWTLLIANAFTSDEKLTRAKVTGIMAGFAGVALLIGSGAAAGLTAPILAQFAVLGATLSYGFAAVFAKRFRGIDPLVVAAGQLTASSIFMAMLSLSLDRPWTLAVPSWQAIAALAGLSLLCTALAYLLYFHILSQAGATNASLVTLLVPPSAILLGAVFLGETLEWMQLAGLAMIVLGLLVIDGRFVSALRRARRA